MGPTQTGVVPGVPSVWSLKSKALVVSPKKGWFLLQPFPRQTLESAENSWVACCPFLFAPERGLDGDCRMPGVRSAGPILLSTWLRPGWSASGERVLGRARLHPRVGEKTNCLVHSRVLLQTELSPESGDSPDSARGTRQNLASGGARQGGAEGESGTHPVGNPWR